MSVILSPFIKLITGEDGPYGKQIAHWCPGCSEVHLFNLTKPNYNGAIWSWDGNVTTPTFRPSMHIRVGPYIDPDDPSENIPVHVCHYNINAGFIQFHSDSSHSLSGRTVPLPEFPSHTL